MTRRAKFTVEIEETVVLRQQPYLIREYCPCCRAVVDMLSPEVLSLVTGTTEREVFRLVETGKVHFAESGRIVVCPTCISKAAVSVAIL